MSYYQKGNGIAQDISPSPDFFIDESKSREKYTTEEVREYLLKVVSGTILPLASEHGYMYVSFEKLKELVEEEGYNIVRVLNEKDLSPYKIHIEYQTIDKTNNNKHGR